MTLNVHEDKTHWKTLSYLVFLYSSSMLQIILDSFLACFKNKCSKSLQKLKKKKRCERMSCNWFKKYTTGGSRYVEWGVSSDSMWLTTITM